MQGKAVVLHQDRLRRQLIALDKLGDRFRLAGIDDFAIQLIFHCCGIRRSQTAATDEIVMHCKAPDPNLSKPVRVLGGEGLRRFRRGNVRR
jgi:hypothetical protein